MFSKASIEQALGVTVIRDPELERQQDLWRRVAEGKAEWNTGPDGVPSLFLAASLGREVANATTFERKTEITGNDALSEQYKAVDEQMPTAVRDAYMHGSIVLKPYVRGGRILVTIATPRYFHPVKYNEIGELVSCAFSSDLQKVDENYTLVELQEWDENAQSFTFTYKAFRTTEGGDIGKEVALTTVPEWAHLQPEITFYNIPRPLFVEVNMENKQSGFANAVDLIRLADQQYGRVVWEYEAGEMAIDASIDLFKKTGRTNADGTPAVAIPTGKRRLFRINDATVGDGKSMEAWVPTLRDANFFAGLNEHKRAIEFACAIAYATISDPNLQAKTATEIRSAKQRFLITISTIQRIIEQAYTELAESMSILGQLYELFPASNYKISFTWGDSVMEDPDVEYQRRKELVAMGLLKREKFYAWYFGMDEAKALQEMPEMEAAAIE